MREAATAINDAPIEGAYAALAAKLDGAPINDEPLVERAINAHYRLGRPPTPRRWRNTPRATAPTPAMRAEALTAAWTVGQDAAA